MQRFRDFGEQPDGIKKMINSHAKDSHPKISKKIRACQRCQSQKIKCDMAPGDSACARCHRLAIPCIFNKSLQTLLEDDYAWKKAIEQNTTQLHSAVLDLFQQLGLLPPESLKSGLQILEGSELSCATESLHPIKRHDTPNRGQDIYSAVPAPCVSSPNTDYSSMFDGNALSTPMASLFEVTKVQNFHARVSTSTGSEIGTAADAISKGKIGLEDAEQMFERFSSILDQHPWCRVALVHDNLRSVRKSSPLLLAVIVAVAALHTTGREALFDVAYAEIVVLACESMFACRHTLDDIRAFCLGAFWLPDISWTLSDHAVRLATQLALHKSCTKAIRGQHDHIERARLWYLLYVCDRQLSFAYGRPHIMQDDTPIYCHKTFLQLPGMTQFDWHLHSQVAICHILGRVYRQFGTETDKPLSEEELAILHAFNAQIDDWKAQWECRPVLEGEVAAQHSRVIFMHWNSARLQVNALALRGSLPHQAQLVSTQRRHFVNLAIAHSMRIFRFILEDSSIRKLILRGELFLQTMVTYAAVLLLTVHMNWRPACLNVDIGLTSDLVARSVHLLNQAKTGKRHLVLHVTNGLMNMLTEFKELEMIEMDQTPMVTNLSNQPSWDMCGQNPWLALGSAPNAMFGDINLYPGGQEYLAPMYA